MIHGLRQSPWAVLTILVLFAVRPARGEDQQSFEAKDSLESLTNDTEDACKCLATFAWKPGTFSVRLDPKGPKDNCDFLVRFPTPHPTDDAVNDLVAMEWYRPKNKDGVVQKAPALVIVHESGSSMPAGRAIARGIRDRGLHAFLIHLPHYGLRRVPGKRPDETVLMNSIKQGIADVRRARDAVAVLPDIDTRHIGLQGTSLGGFVAALTGSLDHGFNSVFIMLAGGDLYDMVQNGRRETQQFRDKMAQAGYQGEKLKEVLSLVEPTRIAHRLDPKTTWLFAAMHDEVVPIRNARKLAKAAKLDEDHHAEMLGGHISAALYLPVVMDQIVKEVRKLEKPGAAPPKS